MTCSQRICMLSALATLALAVAAHAADPAAVIKYRQSTMSALGGHMSSANAILKGEAGQKAHLAAHLDGIVATAKMARDLFPAGSDKGETNALPAVWEKGADFQKAAAALEVATAKLSAAKPGDAEAVKAAFGEVGKACKGCHDAFRMKK
jgi:cytochrome c556